MKRLFFKANSGKTGAEDRRVSLEAVAVRLGFEVVGDGREADMVIVLGGDGTILRAVHEFGTVPVLGFNLGGLGYLSSVGGDEAEAALQMLAEGRYSISERALLEARGGFVALNDIVVTRETGGHSTLLDLEADGKPVTSYMADGLIFSTPTGSTAYSLAAGGPVLLPDSKCFVVTPANPHALGVRPLVISDGVRFRVTARRRASQDGDKVGVYADGEHVMTLEDGESVEIAKSRRTAQLVELEGYDPCEVMARKLGWRGNSLK